LSTLPTPFVPSPCTGECRLDALQFCTGCHRHAQEIAEWPAADSIRRAEIRQAALRRALPAAGQEPGHDPRPEPRSG